MALSTGDLLGELQYLTWVATRVASARREKRSPISFYFVLTSDIFHRDDEYRR